MRLDLDFTTPICGLESWRCVSQPHPAPRVFGSSGFKWAVKYGIINTLHITCIFTYAISLVEPCSHRQPNVAPPQAAERPEAGGTNIVLDPRQGSSEAIHGNFAV